MIWVYGICDRPDRPPPRAAGLALTPLEGLREGALQAIFTRHASASMELVPEALWAHERVVECLLADRAVLPMRFGSKVDDDDTLRRFLAERQAERAAALTRIKGRVEVGVRVLSRLAARPQAVTSLVGTPTGHEYVRDKLHEARQVKLIASALHEPLAALAADNRVQTPRSPDEVLRSAYLVDRRGVPEFRAAVERLQARNADVAILCTGPWPAYSFVGDGK